MTASDKQSRARLSEHFTLEELTFSQTAARNGIDNTPPDEILPNLRRLAEALERVRAHIGAPIRVSSGYRCLTLNQKIAGSSKTSAHVLGLAADISVDGMSAKSLAQKIAAMDHEFDQIICEYDRWVHVGLSLGKPRRELLTIRHGSGWMRGIV
jgi:zinc D-Ala-D-Ala carboxypeptidase